MSQILHVIEDLFAESGGPPAVVIELARHQALAGRRVAVVSTHGARREDERVRIDALFREAGVAWIDLAREGSATRRGLDAMVARVAPSVMHLHGMWGASVRHGAGVARARGTPYVMSTHGMLHPYALAQSALKKRVYLAVFPRILKSAGEVFALNREEADFVARRFRVRASVLPNGIDAAAYEGADAAAFRSAFPAIGVRPFLLFVGRVHPIKGVDQLVRSYAIARTRGLSHELVVIGPEDGGGDAARRAAVEGGVATHVHFIGGVFGALKLGALAASDAVVHRPRFEGFGLAVVEGLASGRPVVTTELCRLDGAGEAGALLQAADDDSAFADAMVAVTADAARAVELAQRGRAWARAQFDWASLVRRLDEAYARVGSGATPVLGE